MPHDGNVKRIKLDLKPIHDPGLVCYHSGPISAVCVFMGNVEEINLKNFAARTKVKVYATMSSC